MSTSVLVSVSFVTVALAVGLMAGTRSDDPDPSPEWTPAEVVRIQVEAMQRNDQPVQDAGIATAFRFASPSNRAATGPLDRFTEMVHGPGYRALLNAEQAEYGMIRVEGDVAVQQVTLTGADGQRTSFLFGLSRQRGGPCDGCWMTDAVVQQEPVDSGTTRV